MKFKFNEYPSTRLYSIAKNIVEKAFFMGGYKVLYYEAELCNYRFPDGKACFDKRTLNPSINCPVCGGSGVVYKDPIETIAIVIDNPNAPQRRREGVFFVDNFRMVTKPEIPVKLLKLQEEGRLFFIRDRFDIYSANGTLYTSVYVDSEPKDIWLAGMLYKSFKVSTHYLSARTALGKEDVRFDNSSYTEVVESVNVLNAKNEEIEDILKNIFIDAINKEQ